MKLADAIAPGDWLLFYPKPNQWLGRVIKTLTFSKVSHAALCVGPEELFQIDGAKTEYVPSSKYDNRHIAIIRVRGLQGKDLKPECDKYRDAFYSYWDIATNAIFFWLAAPIRRKAVGYLGTKRFMVCSELVSRITFCLTGREELRDYGGLTPEDLREIAKEYPDEYTFKPEYDGTYTQSKP